VPPPAAFGFYEPEWWCPHDRVVDLRIRTVEGSSASGGDLVGWRTATMDVQTPAGGRPALDLEGVSRTYRRGPRAVHALRGVDARVYGQALTAVMGPSGSGKSTFLQCAAGLDRPTSGTVRLAGREISRVGERELTRLRRKRIGFVFQSFAPGRRAA
jgi:ABC-type glutathione transport system ATPase component